MYRSMQFEITRNATEGPQFFSELTILFVVEGTVAIRIQDTAYLLGREDVIVINPGVFHEIRCIKPSILSFAKYDNAMVGHLLEDREGIILCNSQAGDGKDYRKVCNDFHELIYQYIRHSHKTASLQNSLLFRLLDHIIEDFHVSEAAAMEIGQNDDLRLQQIYRYVSRNYRTGISLTQLAESMYVSTSTLSRFFKKQTGMYFVDYVNRMRCQYAAQNLLYTNQSITKLAVDCGFSNPSSFNKVFRGIYGLTPTEYRKARRGAEPRMSDADAPGSLLRQELKEKESVLNPAFQGQKEEIARIDTGQGTPFCRPWSHMINIGSMYSLTTANVQNHAVYLAEHLGFTHARITTVFSRKLLITDGEQTGNYNYDIVDSVLDFLSEHHIRPFFDFGIRPDSVMLAENQPLYSADEYVLFRSRQAWEALFEDFLRHIVRRYGKEEVEQWLFEIPFYEVHETPGRYYQAEDYDPIEVFSFAWRTIKHLCPGAKVGGPGAVVNWQQEFVRSFGSRLLTRGIRPDFVSFLLYPYETQEVNGQAIHTRSDDADYERQAVSDMHALMAESGLGDCELYITEWNPTLSNRDYLNDSCFKGAYIAKKISEIWDQADSICLRSGTDWTGNYYDARSIVNGADGILTKDNIRKPAYFALQFLNELGGTLIAAGEHYLLTKEQQNYYILCFNFKWYGLRYLLNGERAVTPESLENSFSDRDPLELQLILQGMPQNVPYILKSWTINEENGSILGEWKKFQYDRHLDRQDIRYIRESCFARMRMERKTAENGTLSLKRTLLPNEITIIHIREDLV